MVEEPEITGPLGDKVKALEAARTNVQSAELELNTSIGAEEIRLADEAAQIAAAKAKLRPAPERPENPLELMNHQAALGQTAEPETITTPVREVVEAHRVTVTDAPIDEGAARHPVDTSFIRDNPPGAAATKHRATVDEGVSDDPQNPARDAPPGANLETRFSTWARNVWTMLNTDRKMI